MTISEIKEKIKLIKSIKKCDVEAAHARVDDLYIDVLKDIAKNNNNSKNLAKEALKAEKINFERWCA